MGRDLPDGGHRGLAEIVWRALLFAVPLAMAGHAACAQSDLPPLRPTWERLVQDTFGCQHEEWTSAIWSARVNPKYRGLPLSMAVSMLIATTDKGECKIFNRGERVLIDNARIDLSAGFGPIHRPGETQWFWITIAAMPAETPNDAYPSAK